MVIELMIYVAIIFVSPVEVSHSKWDMLFLSGNNSNKGMKESKKITKTTICQNKILMRKKTEKENGENFEKYIFFIFCQMQKPVSILTLKKYKSLKNDFFIQKNYCPKPLFSKLPRV